VRKDLLIGNGPSTRVQIGLASLDVRFAEDAPPPVQFAQRSARHHLTVSIDDLDLQMRMDAADRGDPRFGRLIP
jgi:hypothetical protein